MRSKFFEAISSEAKFKHVRIKMKFKQRNFENLEKLRQWERNQSVVNHCNHHSWKGKERKGEARFRVNLKGAFIGS